MEDTQEGPAALPIEDNTAIEAEQSQPTLDAKAPSPAMGSSSTPPKEDTTTVKKETVVDEATIQKILKFWNHPSLQQVSAAEKQEYLKQKGITTEQIFSAWDRILDSQQKLQQQQQQQQQSSDRNGDWVSSFQAKHQSQQQQQQQPQQPTQPQPSMHPSPGHPPFSSYNTSTNPLPPQYDNYEEEPNPGPNLALVAIGGFLGLLAAATVRWLNGGDFLLLPPASRNTGTDVKGGRVLNLQQQQQPQPSASDAQESTVDEDEDDEEDEDEEDDDDDDPELARYLSSTSPPPKPPSDPEVLQQALAQLNGTFQQHVTAQQRILQKMTSTNTSSGLESSMQLLRKQTGPSSSAPNTSTDPLLWYKLVELQVELVALKRDWNGGSEDVEQRLDNTLKSLQTVLDELKPPGPTLEPSKAAETTTAKQPPATVEKTETTVTENSPNSNVDSDDEDGTKKDSVAPPAITSASDSETQASFMEPLPQESTTATPPVEIEKQDDNSHTILRQVRKAMIDLVRQNTEDPKALKAASQIMYLYMNNLAKNPHVPKFRKVFTSNQSYQKVEQLQGGQNFLQALGFVPSADGRVLEWQPDGDDRDKQELLQTYYISEAAAALAVLKALPSTTDASGSVEAILSLLEKALDVLPNPPPPTAKETSAEITLETNTGQLEPAADVPRDGVENTPS